MLKAAGCILLFISCTCLGFLKASAFKARTKELEDILELMKILEIQITYRKNTLEKTFNTLGNDKPCWFSGVLQSCSTGLARRQSLQDAWEHAIGQEENSPLTEEDMEIIKDLSIGLGKSDIQGQRRILESMGLRLTMQLQKAREAEQKQGRMYKGLGTAIGIVIVILII